MAKTSTAATMQPFVLATGNGIYYEEIQAVAEMLNYSMGFNSQSYVSLITGDDLWWTGGTGELGTHRTPFTGAVNSWITVFQGHAWIDSDYQVISVEAGCVMAAANTGEVRITVGGASATLTPFAAASTTRLSSNINVSSTGTGWQLYTVEVRTTAGTSASNSLRDFRIFSQDIAAADLPDPVDS